MHTQMINGVVVQMTPEDVAGWEDERNALTLSSPVFTRLYKSTFVSRCTNDELVLLTAHLATENIKFREMYAACDFFVTTDSLFAVLYWTVAEVLGGTDEPNFERADLLLAPEA